MRFGGSLRNLLVDVVISPSLRKRPYARLCIAKQPTSSDCVGVMDS